VLLKMGTYGMLRFNWGYSPISPRQRLVGRGLLIVYGAWWRWSSPT
jgi:NADH:ubiquinone oxidoreductase subunit 4 (subunit M)